MAAVVVNGCADYSTTISSTKLKECNEIEEKPLNGKVKYHKNGYVMSPHLTNGVSVSSFFYFILKLRNICIHVWPVTRPSYGPVGEAQFLGAPGATPRSELNVGCSAMAEWLLPRSTSRGPLAGTIVVSINKPVF